MILMRQVLPCLVVFLAAAATAETKTGDEFARCADPAAVVRKLAGDMKFTEGPVWVPRDGGYLVFSDTGGHLMQHGMVDLVIVGTDRTTRCGDVANKIGTYVKALAAKDNDVPFYVALPSSTFDWSMRDGLREIPIEQRDGDEVKYTEGWHDGHLKEVLVAPVSSPAANYGFDVTPARLVTGLITERGICPASEKGILTLFPERAPGHE